MQKFVIALCLGFLAVSVMTQRTQVLISDSFELAANVANCTTDNTTCSEGYCCAEVTYYTDSNSNQVAQCIWSAYANNATNTTVSEGGVDYNYITASCLFGETIKVSMIVLAGALLNYFC